MNEGWDWVLIQSHPCPQCGLQPAAVPQSSLGRLVVGAADAWCRFLATADPAFLRHHPGGGRWSPLEYGAHARDMLRVFGERIQRAVSEDNPDVPWFDHHSAAAAGRYNEMDPVALGEEINQQAASFAVILRTLSRTAWYRTAIRDGTDRFTVAGMGCFALHEAHHHLLDANGAVGL